MTKQIIIISQIMVFIIFLLLWEMLVKYNFIDEFLFSKPSKIFLLMKEYAKHDQIMIHVRITVLETILGLLIGSLIGFIVASLLWFFPLISRIMMPFMLVLNALPKTALAPIFIIWVGTNTKGIVFVAISISVIITILSLLNFFNNVDPDLKKMLQSLKANKLHIFRYLILPSNVFNILNTIKINVGLSFIGVIVGEFIVSKAGIGYLIMYGSQVFRLDLVMMGVCLLALVSILFNLVINGIEYLIKRKEKWN